jgi:hypothetical protein
MMSSAYSTNETLIFSRHSLVSEEEYLTKNAVLYHSGLDILPFGVNLADAYSLRAVTEVASDPTHLPWGQDFGHFSCTSCKRRRLERWVCSRSSQFDGQLWRSAW